MTTMSVAPLDASMTTGPSVPPAKLCPDLGLVAPTALEQSPCAECRSDVPPGTAKDLATSTKCGSYNYDWEHSRYLLEWSDFAAFDKWHWEEELHYSIKLIASTVKHGGPLLSPLGCGVASRPNWVQYSHTGLIGTAEDLLSQTTKLRYHMINQVIQITCEIT